jgi:hypothetical protein
MISWFEKSKLISFADDPFKILEKINDNAYKLELPPEFGVSPIFNILDLRPYLGEEDEVPLRTTSIQEGEDDEDITMLDTTIPSIELQGPITRSRAQQLRRQVNSFLCSSANDHGEQVGHQEGAGEPRKYAQHGESTSQFGIQKSNF